MKVSVSMWSYRMFFESEKMDLVSFVQEVKRIKADGFEIFPQYLGKEPEKNIALLAELAKKNNLEISALIVGNDFNKPTLKERTDEVEKMRWFIKNASENGIFRLNTFTGYHVEKTEPLVETFRVVDCYREVVSLACEKKVFLCIENHSSVCSDADSLLFLIKMVGSENLVTNPDISNFVPEFYLRSESSREVMYKETEKIAPLAKNAHLKIDTFKETGEHPYIDVERYINILKKYNYTGHIVLEYYGNSDPSYSCNLGVKLLRKFI